MSISAVIEGNPASHTKKPVIAAACKPSAPQLRYLACGVGQPGGKLPLFDEYGQEFSIQTIRSCIDKGWAEPWFDNPVNPGWIVCRLTKAGHTLAASQTMRAAGN